MTKKIIKEKEEEIFSSYFYYKMSKGWGKCIS